MKITREQLGRIVRQETRRIMEANQFLTPEQERRGQGAIASQQRSRASRKESAGRLRDAVNSICDQIEDGETVNTQEINIAISMLQQYAP